jgi:hypothetical protein
MALPSYAVSIRRLISESDIPQGLLGAADGAMGAILDRVFFTSYGVVTEPDAVGLRLEVLIVGEVALALPGLDGLAFVLGGDGQDNTTFKASFVVGEDLFGARLEDVSIALRFPPDILQPVTPGDGAAAARFAQIESRGTISLDRLFNLHFDSFGSFSLRPAMLGKSGIVISADNVLVDFSRTETLPEIRDAGFDDSFMGVFIGEAAVVLPDTWPALAPHDLKFKQCVIGTGGFSGRLEANYYDAATKTYLRPDSELFGIPFRLRSVVLALHQNAFVESAILGEAFLPFFDGWVEVEAGLDLAGGFHVRLAGTDADGLKTVHTSVLDLALDSIAFEVKNGVFTAKVGGKVRPTFGNLDWPEFTVKELSIDSKGHVHLDGGWLDVTEPRTLDFHGFTLEITKLGFGKTDDGGKWVGFSGGLKLVDGLQAGASVDGLRLTWYDDGRQPGLAFEGIGVELAIPDVLYFKGAVSYHKIDDAKTGETIHRFDGDIRLELVTPELSIDGTLVIGTDKGPQGKYTFFALYLDAELPTGIALAGTGLAITGMAGMFALAMEPNKTPAQQWYSMDHTQSWYHSHGAGVTDLKNKWQPHRGSFALGAGLSLGTFADNSYTFSGRFLFVLVFPGPVAMFVGSGQFLQKRAEGQDDAVFRALAVLDGRAGSLLIGLDAEYKTGKKGELIEISGSMEAFYALNDPGGWHLYLGEAEPRERRIRALFGRFVEANAYFMLDAHQLAVGAWFGYDDRWQFGPLALVLKAWADGSAVVSFKPAHFRGVIDFEGAVALQVFKFHVGLTLAASLAADLFTPFLLRGDFSVALDLPWPLSSISVSVVLQWGPRPQAPLLPLPVKAVAVEHLKSTVVWPLLRGKYLLPSWDDGAGFLAGRSPETVPDLRQVPRVPLDGRLSVTFDRSVHDEARVGINLQQIVPSEPIGSPGAPVVQVRYVLQSLELHRWDDRNGWQLAARSPKADGTPALFGSWALVPPLPAAGPPLVGQTKLLCGVKMPFEFTRATGSSWEEWVSDALPGYPCIPELPSLETCFGFAALQPGSRLESPWTIAGPPAFRLSWSFGPATVRALQVPAEAGPVRQAAAAGPVRQAVEAGPARTVTTLCFPAAAARRGLRIRSSVPGRSFRIVLAPGAAVLVPAGAAPGVPPRLGGETIGLAPTCIDLRPRSAGTVANPWSAAGVSFTVRGADGSLLPVARLERWGAGPLGLNAGFRLDVDLPCASAWAELIVTHRPPFRIVAFDAAGTVVATHAPQGTAGETTETIRLEGVGITRLEVYAAGNEKLVHRVCYQCSQAPGLSATGHDADGHTYGPFSAVGDVLTVPGAEMTEVVVTANGPFCLEQVCVTPDPEVGQAVRREEVIQHISEELARWQAEGEVLAPHTAYRLTIRTRIEPDPVMDGMPAERSPEEHAYFRTDGPPGLAQLEVPDGTDASKPFLTGLEDLTRYVGETDPPTVPQPGEKPTLFRPFYRAYDIGVEFNEDYVEQMYRMDRRDLGLYLFDASNQVARDARGRLLVLANRWGKAATLTLSDQEKRWITLIDAATCLTAKLDPQTFPHDSALGAVEPDRVLAPDTLYEARLVPLLLHEAFAGASPGDVPSGWYAEDAGPGGPSRWRVMEQGEPPSRFVEQASTIGSAVGPERPGAVLLLADPPGLDAADPGRPANWTDIRLSIFVRSAAGGAAGVVFRHGGPGIWYRFALHERGRSLIKAGPAGVAILAADGFTWRRNRDYLLTVEAIGNSLRAYVDGEPVFDVADGDLAAGRIGLYACQCPGARFTDLRVDDFRAAAPVAYRFQLITSLFANFFHHLHSFGDETWTGALGPDAGAPLGVAGAPSFLPPTAAEARAYEELAAQALGQAALQRSTRVEVTRFTRPSGGPVLLLRSPEPLGWQRVDLALSRPAHPLPAPRPPGFLKLTDVAFGAVRPEEEAVTLLLAEAAALAGQRIELRELPGPLAEPSGDPVLRRESFLDPGALAQFTIIDAGPDGGPSNWQVEGGALLQLAPIGGGAEPALPGTQAMTGDPAWTDYRLTADLRSDAGASVGVVFRWGGLDNHYRLSADATLGFRRCVKLAGGVATVLWEDQGSYNPGESFRLEVEAVGPRLTGYIDGVRLFAVADASHAAGQVGVYAANDHTARCERLEVRRPSLEGQAELRDSFASGDLSGWSLISEAAGVPVAQAAAWGTAGGALRLQSLLAQGGDPDYPGALAVAGDPAWTDVIFRLRLRSNGGAIGVVFRGQNLANYYRFAMSRERGVRQLIKRVGGKAEVLWMDNTAYEVDRSYELTIAAAGTVLRGWLDGVPLFVVEDSGVPAGRIALYAWSNPEAWFSEVWVWTAARAFAGWLVEEPFATAVPGRWSFLDQSGKPDPVPWTAGSGELRAEPDPATWEAPSGGVDGVVHALAAAGGQLYAGGDLAHAGSIAASRIAVWTGGEWQALGAGVDGTVRAIVVDGDRVYVGGQFSHAGGHPAGNVAAWDRAAGTWAALGGGIDGPVFALAVMGDRLFAGGQFATAGGAAAANLAAWDGKAGSWAAVGGGVDGPVQALAARGGRLVVGGVFGQAGGQPASRVALWDGARWVAAAGVIDGPVSAIALGDGGGSFFIGGEFTAAGGVAATRIARWTGSAWAPLGGGVDGPVDALVLDGNQLWAGGRFTAAGGAPAGRIAHWHLAAQAWSPVAGGLPVAVSAIALENDRLWLGGAFTTAAGAPALRVAALPLGRTRFAVAQPAAPDDFRLAVRLVPGVDGAAAIVLRFADANHHLVLWFDAEHGFRRLVRTAGDQSEVLWQDATRPAAGREYTVTLDATGDRLTGHVDGVELFDLTAAPTAGSVGVALRRSPGARYRELRLGEPAWTCWHAFPEEEALLAGTRVRVHQAQPAVSTAPGPAQAEPGVVVRTVALSGESGRLRLRPNGAELRLTALDGVTGHGRAFLAPDAYSPVAFKALRKEDGTGLFLVPDGDAGAGPLRLVLTYYRDRPQAGRAFSQAGDKGPERVALDIP